MAADCCLIVVVCSRQRRAAWADIGIGFQRFTVKKISPNARDVKARTKDQIKDLL